MISFIPSRIRVIAIALTVMVMVIHYLLPPRQIVLHPSDPNRYNIYSDGDWGGASTSQWLDRDALRWQCDLKRSPAYAVCGLSIHWGDAVLDALDASRFDTLAVTLRYQGPAHTLRVYLRNYDSPLGVAEDRDTHKFMYVNVPTVELGTLNAAQITQLKLSELQVADWWKEEHNVDRNNAKPNFNRLTSFGIDFPFPQVMGKHTLQLDSVVLTGEWITAEMLYLSIILAWLGAAFVETTLRMYRWRKVAKENLKQVQDLTDYAEALRVKSERYRELSHVDTLTEVYNRFGFMQALKRVFGRGPLNGCLLIIDIDFFKTVNDRYGHVVGDETLREVAQLIAANIRKGDVFARWGGEEFVLLVTEYELHQAQALAEKLRKLIASHRFKDVDSAISVSIGLTAFTKTDSLNAAISRADEALYQAKALGRNQVASADGLPA